MLRPIALAAAVALIVTSVGCTGDVTGLNNACLVSAPAASGTVPGLHLELASPGCTGDVSSPSSLNRCGC